MENKRIRLLFVVSSLCIGGAEKHLITLLNHLDSERFWLSLVYLKDDPAQLPQIDIKRIEGKITACHVCRKIDFSAVHQIMQKIEHEQIQIIVCVNTYPLLYAWLARMQANQRPRIVELFHTTEIITIKNQLQMLFYWPFFAISDMLVYVCENQRRYWRAKALRARKDTVIHNGIDIDHFADNYGECEKGLIRSRYRFGKNDYVVGVCAAMRPEKAHMDMLLAIAALKEKQIEVKCLFIGDGPERDNLEASITALGLNENVQITGLVNDIRPPSGACDVMAMVSHSETFSIAALEGMALGKPVIISDIGGAAEQVTNGVNGYLYQRGDIAGLADALEKLRDPATRQRLGRQARATVAEHFSLNTMVHAYERLFVGLIRSSPTPIKAEATDAA